MTQWLTSLRREASPNTNSAVSGVPVQRIRLQSGDHCSVLAVPGHPAHIDRGQVDSHQKMSGARGQQGAVSRAARLPNVVRPGLVMLSRPVACCWMEGCTRPSRAIGLDLGRQAPRRVEGFQGVDDGVIDTGLAQQRHRGARLPWSLVRGTSKPAAVRTFAMVSLPALDSFLPTSIP